MPYWEFHLSDPWGIRTATLLTDGVLKLNRGALSSAGNWYGHMVDLLHGAVFALCVMIISRSLAIERISPVGKLALLLGVISYIASFYVRIKL